MDDKIKEILEKPEVPEYLLPENIPLLIKEHGRKRKISFIKTVTTVAAAAACVMIITFGVKVITDNNMKFTAMDSVQTLNQTKSSNAGMCENAAENEDIYMDTNSEIKELNNIRSFEMLSGLLTEETLSQTEISMEKTAGANIKDTEVTKFDNDGISAEYNEEENILIIKDDSRKAEWGMSELFENFSDNEIIFNDLVFSGNNAFVAASFIQDSQIFTCIRKIDTKELSLSEDDPFYVQSGKYIKAVFSGTDELFVITDQKITADNSTDVIPAYGEDPHDLISADIYSVYCSDSLEEQSCFSLDFINVSRVKIRSSDIEYQFASYVCPSPDVNISISDGTKKMTVYSDLIPETVDYNFESAIFEIE